MEKKKLIGAAAFSLALAGGGVAGAIFGSPLSSGAQESSTTTTVAPGAPDTNVAPGGAHPMGRGMRPVLGFELDSAAKAIGITPDELKTELAAGKTIAEVAQAHG